VKATNVKIGECSLGMVYLFHFVGSPDDAGNFKDSYYEVRAGAQHLGIRKTKAAALAIAEALCK